MGIYIQRHSSDTNLRFHRDKYVIPAEAGIRKNTGFRVKPGMTDSCKRMSPCISGKIGE
ncbi:hypothetical protein KSU1_C0688 [Candidatus Jettenia caeni]|uniref:Uncharacterized protein n=1 Tax=Candidatus Jettenia caeni TaxID=247490 RepID=I3IKN9_9BACT|nr:hypothetical protein [Candidatus Jettenia sp. AMX1]NUN24222.1 hypothetical protein [Candidatus Jettenia caeni]GAB62284.1 hypothetical protein KSU1_C0688 [Candidatus Jettenia caeni]